MLRLWLRAPAAGPVGKARTFVAGIAFLLLILTLAAFAQINQHPPSPLLNPEVNPMPDANDQMEMRQRNLQSRNFDLANAERLRQMMKATDMLQTMAIALKAEMDKPGPLSQNEIQKAENIEKLAHIVKERMKLTVAVQ
jgi:hypothetical protein